MGLLDRLSGIVGNLFRLGLGGPQLKNNSNAIEARTFDDTGYTTLRGAAPVADNDFATPNFSGPTQTLKIGASSSGTAVPGGAFTIGGFQVIGSALSDAQILADAKAQMLWL